MIDKQIVLGIIPARGGSKGVRKKNIIHLAGRPLIAYTIKPALKSKYLDRVVVSTEDDEIAGISKKYGAEVIKRPMELSQDDTPTMDVVFHVLGELKKNDYVPDIIVLLQPTSPLRTVEDIDKSIEFFVTCEDSHSLVSVSDFDHSPFWALKIEKNYLIPAFDKKYLKMRRQDLPSIFRPNGAIFIARPNILYKSRTFYTLKTVAYLMPPKKSIDVDSEVDLALVELLMKDLKVDINEKIKIGDKYVGGGELTFIVAEAGVNHNGKIGLARKLIDIAKNANADAVKFQTFKTEEIMVKETRKAKYQEETTGKGTQYEMIKKLELSEKDFKELADYAKLKRIIFLSTPFDEKSADLLEKLNVPAFKIGSGDLTNLSLLEYVAKKDKPMIISTGMSTLNEVRDAVNTVRKTGNNQIILLHCTSDYPTNIEDCNLLAMHTLRKEFNVPVGYSDHTLGITVPIVAIAMGASIIEKHFTLSKDMRGPDHRASLEPNELKEMIKQIRRIEKAFGTGEKKPAKSEMEIQKVARKSIVAKINIPEGNIISWEMLTVKRPGTGLAPKYIKEIVGKKAKKDIKRDEIITINMLGD